MQLHNNPVSLQDFVDEAEKFSNLLLTSDSKGQSIKDTSM